MMGAQESRSLFIVSIAAFRLLSLLADKEADLKEPCWPRRRADKLLIQLSIVFLFISEMISYKKENVAALFSIANSQD